MVDDSPWIYLLLGIIIGAGIVYFLTRGKMVKYEETDKGFVIVEEFI